jgi:hypothetical protein
MQPPHCVDDISLQHTNFSSIIIQSHVGGGHADHPKTKPINDSHRRFRGDLAQRREALRGRQARGSPEKIRFAVLRVAEVLAHGLVGRLARIIPVKPKTVQQLFHVIRHDLMQQRLRWVERQRHSSDPYVRARAGPTCRRSKPSQATKHHNTNAPSINVVKCLNYTECLSGFLCCDLPNFLAQTSTFTPRSIHHHTRNKRACLVVLAASRDLARNGKAAV